VSPFYAAIDDPNERSLPLINYGLLCAHRTLGGPIDCTFLISRIISKININVIYLTSLSIEIEKPCVSGSIPPRATKNSALHNKNLPSHRYVRKRTDSSRRRAHAAGRPHTLPAASALRDTAERPPDRISPPYRHAKLAPDAVEPFRT
jgi:hypothetical protein